MRSYAYGTTILEERRTSLAGHQTLRRDASSSGVADHVSSLADIVGRQA